MKDRIVKLRFNPGTDTWVDESGDDILCPVGLGIHMEIPANKRVMYLVFTVKPNRQSWELKHTYNDEWPRVSLVGYRAILFTALVWRLSEIYSDGYRYGHIEFNA